MKKVVIHQQYESLNAFINSIPEVFSFQGESIYVDRNELKCFTIDGYNIVVKRYRKPHFINRIIYTYFRASKAQRAYEYALKLIELGLESPSPIAYIETFNSKLLSYSYFISIFEDEFINIRELMEGSQVDDALLNELAIYIYELHTKGVLHLDLSPGNVMYKKTKEKVHFTLIDINRMQFVSKISLEQRFKNFKRLTENNDVITKLAKCYAKVSKLDQSIALRQIAKYSSQFFTARNRKYKDS